MKDEEIFLKTEIEFFPEPYDYEIELIGKEKYLNFIMEFGGVTMYFPYKRNLTIIPNYNVTDKFISNVQYDDLKPQYKELAKIVGIEGLYKLCQNNERIVRYIPKLETLILDIKRNKVRNELSKGVQAILLARKYKICHRTILYLKSKMVLEDYKNGKTIEEISRKYNTDVYYIKNTIERNS